MKKSYTYRGVFGEGVCADLNGMNLIVLSYDSEEDGLYVAWEVIKWPRAEKRAKGRVYCTFEQIRRAATPKLALQPAYELAKKLAEVATTLLRGKDK